MASIFFYTYTNVILRNTLWRAKKELRNNFSKYHMKKSEQIFQLKITLQGSKPPIWRRVLVPGNVTLGDLHNVIQQAMGWTGGHMHHFDLNDTYYGDPHPEMPEIQDQEKIRLADVAKTSGMSFEYLYDFGDNWEHLVKVEKILPQDPKQKYPVCLAGKRACPPEDCGGIWGYEELLETLSDPKHPEHEDMRDWMGLEEGEEFDPEKFDPKNCTVSTENPYGSLKLSDLI